jgi:hypothetical protein
VDSPRLRGKRLATILLNFEWLPYWSPDNRHCLLFTMAKRQMLFRLTISIWRENQTKHTNEINRQSTEIFILQICY